LAGPSSARADRSPPRTRSAVDCQPYCGQQHQERDAAADGEDDHLVALKRLLDLRVELAGEFDALDVVHDPEVDGMPSDQKQGFADHELHDKVGAATGLEFDRPLLVDREPQHLCRWHRVLQWLRIGGEGARDHTLVAVDEIGLDDGPTFDRALEHLGHGCLVAQGF
jgi:hypothetical protein